MCSASTSRHIASQRSIDPAQRVSGPLAAAVGDPGRAGLRSAAAHRWSVRLLTPSSAAFAWYRSSSGSDGSYSGRGSPGSAAAGVPERYPVSASRR